MKSAYNKIFTFLVFLISISAMAVCKAIASGLSDEAPQLLSVWANKSHQFVMKDIATRFMRQDRNEGLTVNLKFFTPSDINARLAAALAQGSGAPDVVEIDMPYISRFFAIRQSFYNLYDEPFEALRFEEDFPTSRWQNGITRYGQLYGLPFDASPGAVYIREDFLKNSGLAGDGDDAEQAWVSWDDFIEMGRKLCFDRNGDGRPEKYLINDASELFTACRASQGCGNISRKGNLTVDNFATLKALKLARKARELELDFGSAIWSPVVPNAVRKGKIVSLIGGPWLQPMIAGIWAPETSGKWRLAKLPGKSGISMGGTQLAIPSQSGKSFEAWEFVEFASTTVEAQSDFLRHPGLLPALLTVLEDEDAQQKPDVFFGGQKTIRKYCDLITKTPNINLSPADPVVNDLLYREINSAISGKEEPEKVLKNVQQALEKKVSLILSQS